MTDLRILVTDVNDNAWKFQGALKLQSDPLASACQTLDILQYSSPYNLTVIASDDGSCCECVENKQSVHTSKANFPHCADYKVTAKIREGSHEPNGKPIIKVEAADKDSGANGEITYSLYYACSETRKPFVIDAETGELRPSTYYVFDRETRPFEEVTVKVNNENKSR
ncbi:Cadherin domain containing protein [Aphelenchoides avenae]|nr:Cadherin domain containing protein [Aphelenchus avenae]